MATQKTTWHLIVEQTGKGPEVRAYAQGKGSNKEERSYNAKKTYVYGSGATGTDIDSLVAPPWPEKLEKDKGLPWYELQSPKP